MIEREPQLQDYGVTAEDFEIYRGKTPDPSKGLWVSVGLGIFLVGFLTLFTYAPRWNNPRDSDIVSSLLVAACITPFLWFPIVFLVQYLIVRFRRSRLVRGPIPPLIELYKEASRAYRAHVREVERAREEAERVRREVEKARRQAVLARWHAQRERRRKHAEYWMGLSGEKFEQEVATLLQRRGYRGIQLTGRSGDGGIDIRARRERKSLIVQCKRYQKPAGPAIVRELYGSLVDSRADGALLFCTGGFTEGAKVFAKGKPIQLLSVEDIVKVAEAVEGNRVEFTPPAPQRASLWRRRRPRWRGQLRG